MAKQKSILVKLMSQAGTGYFYLTRKNPRRTPEKFTFRKYDPVVKQHVLFTETKKFK
ncbi:hypothetical protein GUITHDRAFT_77421 [Guillardia theta CCMP2712]|uniref:Large ribosomal subunit protein bL33c n=1 Tax=Guillardia theta (strain CCMP2712) TaxID=905079 RepID=L1IPU2_GUITC|nr:hypothetical protein GUITHDRAFT_77421 [Guillardia theta CCMP2712]EKX38117.1 hypothetical protein GUITHDRAFT_77421 [Guillardia theta CCMP2712]|eukprot:XP_005825097.1 hypothetical protein GUITHDRAFT_77421 [Guillardia theta CCMP2712]